MTKTIYKSRFIFFHKPCPFHSSACVLPNQVMVVCDPIVWPLPAPLQVQPAESLALFLFPLQDQPAEPHVFLVSVQVQLAEPHVLCVLIFPLQVRGLVSSSFPCEFSEQNPVHVFSLDVSSPRLACRTPCFASSYFPCKSGKQNPIFFLQIFPLQVRCLIKFPFLVQPTEPCVFSFPSICNLPASVLCFFPLFCSGICVCVFLPFYCMLELKEWWSKLYTKYGWGGWGCSLESRASDQHTTDAGPVPWCSKVSFFFPRQLSVQTFLQCLFIPCVQSYALTSVGTFKIVQSMSEFVELQRHQNTQRAPQVGQHDSFMGPKWNHAARFLFMIKYMIHDTR